MSYLKENRGRIKPYQKPNESSNSNLAQIFIRTVYCKTWLISNTRFTAHPTEFHSKLIDVFKLIPSKSFDPNTKLWTFSIKDHDLLKQKCESLKPNIIFEEIPKKIIDLFSQSKDDVDFSCLSSIEPKLAEILMPFQKEGVCFGISKYGRILIADEMGLGKTYQALAIADFYRDDWPLLICTTASTRDTWLNHVNNLLPRVAYHHVKCLTTNHDYVGDAKIVLSSYTILEKNIEKLLERQFGVIIYDESHTLKNNKAKCTIAADRLARKAQRVILLSGTPALSRPVELFTQIKMLDRSFLNFIDFTTRYCDGKQTSYGWNATGKSNLHELNLVLSKKFMIRRVKSDVLPELAEKSRQTITLDPSQIDISTELNTHANNLSHCRDGRRREEILLSYYADTAIVKKDAVCNYLEGILKEKSKFIVFAHHTIMIDEICDRLSKLYTNFIRIDGSTPNELRTKYVNKFQTDESCQVAVLSLRSCNAGITLTAADLIIFAELDWNPSILAQAESRAHRIGQDSTVVCRYLLAKNTADDVIWKMLQNKQKVLNEVGIFSENLHNSEVLKTLITSPKKRYSIENYFKKEEVVPLTTNKNEEELACQEIISSANQKVEEIVKDKDTDNFLNNDDDDIFPSTFDEILLSKRLSNTEQNDENMDKFLDDEDDDEIFRNIDL